MYVAGGHSCAHAEAFAGETAPGPQGEQTEEPAVAAVPAAHTAQDVWPLWDWEDPEGHVEHELEPASGAYLPGLQLGHVLPSGSAYDPAAQT